MPSLSYNAFTPWANYHLTISPPGQLQDFPQIRIEETARVHCTDLAGLPAPVRFASTAKVLQCHLTHVIDTMGAKKADPLNSISSPYAAGIVGRGWSFAPLIGTPVSQLECDGLVGCSMVESSYLHPKCTIPADSIALVSGGTRLRELVTWAAKQHDRTIPTSGTHLGPTIAGGFGTASHGSRLGYGGLQNAILGIHLITGPKSSVWIERASRPILKKKTVTAMNAKVVRNDAMFEDALIHLGAMGIVNGVAVELVPNTAYGLLKSDDPVSTNWMHQIRDGQFRAVARELGFDAEPSFYEATINPHDPFGPNALHVMYFPSPGATIAPPGITTGLFRASDAVASFSTYLSQTLLSQASMSSLTAGNEQDQSKQDCKMFEVPQIFEYYRHLGEFSPGREPFKPYKDEPLTFDWSGLHSDEITGGIPGALYNASFAVQRSDAALAIPLICEAVKSLPPTFLFTLRFVSNPAGTLAFTRFEENMVIEIDGLSPLYWKLQERNFPDMQPCLEELAPVLATGAMLVRQALDKACVGYSMHWAKLGALDSKKVERDFGPSAETDSPLSRWRRTRWSLLSSEGEKIFWNEAVIQYGLIGRPIF